MLTIEDLPDVKFTTNGTPRQSQPLTVNNVRKVLEHLDLTLRFDMCLGAPAFFLAGERIPQEDVGYAIESVSDVLVKLDINNLARLTSILKELAWLDKFHPMEDMLKSVTWDGRDRIAELTATVVTSTELWPVFLENWLVQVVEGVCGWRRTEAFSLPHVLVLVGGQGVGKTRWLANLGGRWIKTEAELHLSSPSGKDHQLAALKWPMAELAELDGIFRKSDISHMKSFISREEDELRAPYDRRATVRPRMTSFCGSVNEAEFLNDSTGSRRFWPVSVESIVWDFSMDWSQLWAQAYAYWVEEPGFNLTAEEERARGQNAVDQHTLLSPEAEKIAEFYRRHHGHVRFPDVAMNRTEILEMLYGRSRHFSPRQVAEAGRVLLDIVGKHRTIDGKQRAWNFPYNEFASDYQTWPDKNHLDLV